MTPTVRLRSLALMAAFMAITSARGSLGRRPSDPPAAPPVAAAPAPPPSPAASGSAVASVTDPRVADAMVKAGSLSRQGKLAEAESELVGAERLRPEFGPLLEQLARLRIRMGKLDAALTTFEHLIRKGSPFDDRTFVLAAQTLVQRGMSAEGEKRLIDWAGDRHVSANFFAALGILRLGALDLVAAEAQVRKALDADAANEPALKALFQILGKLGKYDEAQPLLDKAVAAKPSSTGIRMLSGSCLMRQSRFAEAKEQFAKIVELEPRSAAAWTNLGSAEHSLGSREEAIKAFSKAIDLDGKAVEAPINLATALEDAGRYAEARDVLLAARRRSIQDVDLLNALTVAYHLNGQLDQAIGVAKESLARDAHQDSLKRLLAKIQGEKAGGTSPAPAGAAPAAAAPAPR